MTISSNLSMILDRMATACARAGRARESCRLVAVSKGQDAAALRAAHEAGQRIFGENYVQELVAKSRALQDLADIEWHFTGHLQRNKVKQVLPLVSLVQTVDSERLTGDVEARLAASGRTALDVLVEVNVGSEPNKSGALPEEAALLVDRIDLARGLRCRGLMVIPPFELDPEQARPWFAGLRELRDRLGGPERLPELSMGMSADYEVAIEEGATLVRVGTAIFGPR